MPSNTAFRVLKRFVFESLAFAILVSATWVASADEPSRLSRLFRLGSGSSSKPSVPAPVPPRPTDPTFGSEPSPIPSPTPVQPGESVVGPLEAIPETNTAVDSPRILPRSRMVRPVTTADPLVTRIALGRATDGKQFGMFLQVFEDGTVIDSEGVHPLGREAVRPIIEVLARGELFKIKGHCGTQSTDFVEHVQMIVYDRRFSTLRAHNFSLAGSAEGCDRSVKHLQTLLDGLQAKMVDSKPPIANPSNSNVPFPTSAPIPLSVESN